jgi:hypothetical protein
MRRLHINQDVAAGLMFAGFGVAGLWFGRELPVGAALRMGPGYMPRLLCYGLLLLGIVIAIKGAIVAGERIERWHWRPLAIVSIAVLAFSLLLEPAGLVVATAAIVIIGAFGGPQFRLVEALALAAGLAIAAVVLFVTALQLPLPIWPPFLV